MKECKYCGTSYADNLSVCPNCGGAKTVTDEERIEESTFKRKEIENRERAVAAPQKQRKAIIGAMAAVAAIAVTIIAIVSINANKPLSNGMTKDEGEQVLADGIAYYDAGNYEAAIGCFAQLPSDSKQYEEAQAMLEQSIDSYRTGIMNKVNSYLQDGNYDAAIELISTTQIVLPDDLILQNAFADAYRENVVKSADAYIQDGKLEEALSILTAAQSTLANDAELQSLYASTFASYKNEIQNSATLESSAYLDIGDYPNAISVLRAAEGKLGTNNKISEQLATIEAEYRKSIVDEAKLAYDDSGCAVALSIISGGLSTLPGDEKLSQYYDLFSSYTPDHLSDVMVIDKSSRHFETNPLGEGYEISDYFDKTIKADYRFGNDSLSGYSSGTGWAEYFLNGNYTTFNCEILTRSIHPSYSFTVYGDGIELFTTGTKNWESGCQSISVNVSNVKKMKISLSWQGGVTFDYGYFYMGNDELIRPIDENELSSIGY